VTCGNTRPREWCLGLGRLSFPSLVVKLQK
jgi:hypothetical protein